jgi:hypothetical protein
VNCLTTRWLATTGILIVAATTTLAVAQVRDETSRNSAMAVDEIPAEVLQTDAGRRMAERLRVLRNSQSAMGSKHPALKSIEAEIETIRQRLGLEPSGNLGEAAVGAVEAMGDAELRQLIRRMALRIESLEQRVDTLERRLEVF